MSNAGITDLGASTGPSRTDRSSTDRSSTDRSSTDRSSTVDRGGVRRAARLGPETGRPTRPTGKRRAGLPAPLHYAVHSSYLLVRNWGFVLFSVILPVTLYVLFDQLFGGSSTSGTADAHAGAGAETTNWAAVYMISMAAYGSLGAAMSGGAQLAVERRSGWFRQLSLTSLPPRTFLWARAGVIMALVLPALILVFLAGFAVGGVRAPVVQWLAALLLMWLSLVPLTVLGIVVGLWVKAEVVQGVTTVLLLVLAMLGGLWFPAAFMPPVMQTLARALPSYWLAELGRYPFGGGAFPWTGVGVLVGWSIGLTVLGALGYRRAVATSKR